MHDEDQVPGSPLGSFSSNLCRSSSDCGRLSTIEKMQSSESDIVSTTRERFRNRSPADMMKASTYFVLLMSELANSGMLLCE